MSKSKYPIGILYYVILFLFRCWHVIKKRVPKQFPRGRGEKQEIIKYNGCTQFHSECIQIQGMFFSAFLVLPQYSVVKPLVGETTQQGSAVFVVHLDVEQKYLKNKGGLRGARKYFLMKKCVKKISNEQNTEDLLKILKIQGARKLKGREMDLMRENQRCA